MSALAKISVKILVRTITQVSAKAELVVYICKSFVNLIVLKHRADKYEICDVKTLFCTLCDETGTVTVR